MSEQEAEARAGGGVPDGSSASGWTPEDFQRRVHVSWSNATPEARVVVQGASDFEHVLVWGAFAVVTTSVGILVGRIAAGFFTPWLVGLVAGALAAWVTHWRRYQQLPTLPKDRMISVDQHPDSRFRIRLVGNARRVEALRHFGDECSEPLTFRVLLGLPDLPKGGQLVLLCGLTLGFIAMLSLVLPPATAKHGGVVGVLSGIGAAAVLMFCWPTYFRVAPGRLDVFRYGFLGHGRPRVRTLDLLNWRVLVNADNKYVVVESPDGARDLIYYRAVADNLGFARAVLEAARSQHVCPPLPDDALTG